MKSIKFYISLLLLTILLSACNLRPVSSADPFDIGNARTYFESLDLDTPESAARTFINAFQRFDFPTVFMILSIESQWGWWIADAVDYGNVQRGNRVPYLNEQNLASSITGEQFWSIESNELEVIFDLFMKAVKEAHKLWIDLSGEVTILSSQNSLTLDGEEAVDVFCEVEGFEELVTIRLVRDPLNNDWRVVQVIAPGGNEEIIPWSYNAKYPQAFVHSKATFAINPEFPRTYYESLDILTPEDAVLTFTNAIMEENYPGVWLILSNQAQEEWDLQFATFRSTMFYTPPDDWMKHFLEYVEVSFEMRSGYLFDDIMLFAKENEFLPINIRGSVNIIKTEESLTGVGDTAIDVYTHISGITGEVIFRLTETPSGRWRVLQVIFPGGDEEIIPWSHPPD